MATAAVARVDNQVPHHGDKIVRRLDEFPELLQALRDGDLVKVRFLWAQFCDGQRTKGVPTAKLKAAASA